MLIWQPKKKRKTQNKMENNNKFDYSEENHIQTMRDELQELKERIEGFESFYYSPEFGKRLPCAEDQNLAWIQLKAMESYAAVLQTRLNRFCLKDKFFTKHSVVQENEENKNID